MVFYAMIMHCKAILSGTIWASEMNFDMNHALGAGSIARPVDLQSSSLPLCYKMRGSMRKSVLTFDFS